MIASPVRPGGVRIRRTADLICRRCGKDFRGIDQKHCDKCRKLNKDGKRVNPIQALALAPHLARDCPEWLEKADWNVVEVSWVALMAEKFHDDAPGTIAVLASCLATIRKRYRENGAPRNKNAHSP